LLQSCITITSFDESEVQYKVAAVGDSITYGLFISNRKFNSYPTQLNLMLGPEWHVGNFGVSGATLLKRTSKSYWDTREFQMALAYDPDIVIIKLGTNDSKFKNWLNKEQFISDYIELIRKFENLASNPDVYVCYPIPAYAKSWGIDNKVISNDIKQMLDIISEKTDVPIIDLYSPLVDKFNFFTDSIHPNAEGAFVIAQEVYSHIKP